MRATYSPDDNKLRLYAEDRLNELDYKRVKEAGFIWAPQQKLFVAPMWTPEREDVLIDFCGVIGDEDTSLTERAEDRAERFEDYSGKRAEEAGSTRDAVKAIAGNIPFGQPILIGHHSEKRARKDAERIESGMQKAVKLWETSEYWARRAKGALSHAKYKEIPAVRARRIKRLETDKRRVEKNIKQIDLRLKFWRGELRMKNSQTGESKPAELNHANARWFCNHYEDVSRCFTLAEYPRTVHTYEGAMSLWSALGDTPAEAIITPEQARDIAMPLHERDRARLQRWNDHYTNRLAYEQAMLADSGGTAADQTKPEVGGACRVGYLDRNKFLYIVKVNKVSVTVHQGSSYGGRIFRSNKPLDKLCDVMSAAQVQEARDTGRLIELEDKTGFHLAGDIPEQPAPRPEPSAEKAEFKAMRETLKAGVQVTIADQLFPTPKELAARVIELADIEAGHRILEPSAGTGALLLAIHESQPLSNWPSLKITAVEINGTLAKRLDQYTEDVRQSDFLQCNGNLGTFDRIVMNPPFKNGDDIRHIKHALTFLNEGGKLVAICANGSRQQEQLQPLADHWEVLPEGTFKDQGTMVNTALIVIRK